MNVLESAVLSAWYCSRPEIRRLLAIRGTEGLRVLVEVEPAVDSSEVHPVWIANRNDWADELQWHIKSPVRLDRFAMPFVEGVRNGDTIVADLCWRDPASFV